MSLPRLRPEDIRLAYYKKEVKPLFNEPNVKYLGEITDTDESELLLPH